MTASLPSFRALLATPYSPNHHLHLIQIKDLFRFNDNGAPG